MWMRKTQVQIPSLWFLAQSFFEAQSPLLWASLVAQIVKNFPVMEETYYARRWEAVNSYSGVKTAVSAGAWLTVLPWHALSRWVPLPQQAIIFSRNNEIAN